MNQRPTPLPRCALPVIESWPLRGAASGVIARDPCLRHRPPQDRRSCPAPARGVACPYRVIQLLGRCASDGAKLTRSRPQA